MKMLTSNPFRTIVNGKVDNLKHKYSETLVRLFQEMSGEYIYQKREARKPNTNSIKYNLVKLGHKLGYRVYANGLTPEQVKEQFDEYGFVCREFLYDVHWYVDKVGEFYTPEHVSLVVESELGDRRKGDKSKSPNPAVKFDFQKLLLANAELRLMVFKTRSLQHLNQLNTYFDEAIKAYDLLRKNDAFLFICFVHDSKEMYYAEKFKK